MLEKGEFVRHEPCNNCGSSDANSLYSNGSRFCYSCRTYTPAEGINLKSITRTMTNATFKGEPERLHKRGISEATCKKYRINRAGNTLRFPYFTSDGVLAGFKVKNKQKVFTYEGQATDTLFGQHLFPTTGKRIVITEGELDAASCYEAMPNWPMLSLPHGAASAKKDLQKQLPLFQGYEKLYYSSMVTSQVVRLPRKRREYYPQVKSKSPVWTLTRIRRMRCKQKTLMR